MHKRNNITRHKVCKQLSSSCAHHRCEVFDKMWGMRISSYHNVWFWREILENPPSLLIKLASLTHNSSSCHLSMRCVPLLMQKSRFITFLCETHISCHTYSPANSVKRDYFVQGGCNKIYHAFVYLNLCLSSLLPLSCDNKKKTLFSPEHFVSIIHLAEIFVIFSYLRCERERE